MVVGKTIVWLIIGALSGTLVARLVTFSKEGLGWWTNLGVGMIGAVVGGLLFGLLGIDLGFGELKISFEDLISAFVGSLICVFAWWLIRKLATKPAGKTWVRAGRSSWPPRETRHKNEQPAHTAQDSGFFMDETAVANAQFRPLVDVTGRAGDHRGEAAGLGGVAGAIAAGHPEAGGRQTGASIAGVPADGRTGPVRREPPPQTPPNFFNHYKSAYR